MAFYTLGCKVNQYDTEAMAERFRQSGYEVVPFESAADVYVINTCTVTHQGDAKSRKLIRRAKRQNRRAVVVVAGCYAQTSPEEVRRIPGVDVIVGNNHRDVVVDLVELARGSGEPVCVVENLFRAEEATVYQELPISGFGSRTRAVVKVQDGCTEFCTYCIIPYARGMLRSRRPGDVVREVRRLAEAGYKEIVLAGIHLGAYGKDFREDIGIAELLKHLAPIRGIERIRLSSIEPMDVDEDLIEVMAAHPNICRHLHLPLQSGCDEVLARMKRRYTTAQFARIVEEARRRLPEIAITTDVMVGFPGETDEHHARSRAFIEAIGFSRLHVFPFSPRKGTPAARFTDQVPPAVQGRRVRELLAVGRRLALDYHRRFVGRELEVLVEEDVNAQGWCEGYTDNYIRVAFDAKSAGWDPDALVNRFVRVRLEHAEAERVVGTLVAPVAKEASGAAAIPGQAPSRAASTQPA
ncbi:MAG TPA: tRNA (N(6)-L-threonylcarbamoyladenosine(37)-C(2))-methylthiotransferase MtaB [Bacillota bacterium]